MKSRPIVRYHGGKWILAPWIISHFHGHKVYVEPYGGGGSVLLRKPRSYAEVYNDLDDEIVNLFQVARDRGDELSRAVTLTPFSRTEYVRSYKPSKDPVERARRTVVRSFMGFGSAAISSFERGPKTTGFRQSTKRTGNSPAHDWNNYPDALTVIIRRLKAVTIENRDALEVMQAHDAPDTLHYLDPPYLHETRYSRAKDRCYKYEMSEADHVAMIKAIRRLQGSVFLSGYDNELYNDMLSGWAKSYRAANADGARKRIEVLWFNRNSTTRQLSITPAS